MLDWPDGETRDATAVHGDAAGYSKLIADNEIETHHTLQTFRAVIEEEIGSRHGEVVQFVGDEFLGVVPTASGALDAAVAIQRRLADANATLPEGRRMRFRLGLNTGTISLEEGLWFGDTINVAARLQAMAERGGINVSKPTLEGAGELPVRIESLGPQRLKNIPEPVQAFRVHDEHVEGVDAKPWRRRIVPPKQPSLAVSPFVNLGSPDDAYLADGLMMGLTISLMTIPGLQLISENSTLGYRSEAFSAQQLGHELGVQHILEGAVQRAGDQLRVMTQVIDTGTGATVWGDRFQATFDDVFNAQDTLVNEIVNALDIAVIGGESARSLRADVDAATVERMYRGLAHLAEGTPDGFSRGSEEFDRVIEHAPDAPQGYSLAAIARLLVALGSPDDEAASMEEAERLARRAIELHDPWGLGYAVLAYAALLKHDWAGAADAVEKVIEARPSCDLSFGIAASVCRYLGRWEEAVDHADRAINLSPLFANWYQSILADAYFVGEEYENAADTAEGVVAADEDNLDALLTLAASQAALGRGRHAAAAAQHARSTKPSLNVEVLAEHLPFADAAIKERFVNRLREAGLN